MEQAAREATIASLVERYLRLGPQRPVLADYLSTVEAAVRDEVAARCSDAAFIERFFDQLPPLRLLPPMPAQIAGCRIDGLLGEGAMGKVYRAHQKELQRDIAIKLVRADAVDHTSLLARLRDEARTLASLDHPGIVKVLFCGEEDGWLYFAMDLVAGKSLAETLPSLLRQESAETTPRPFDRAARIVAETLEALAYAHRQGIVHRDLKPSNIVLDRDEHPKLVDFGLAKAAAAPQRTLPGQLVGTPAYMSPELVARRAHDRVSPDLWAVGVMLFQALTGRLPYDGATTDDVLQRLLRPIAQDPRALTPDVPKPLAAICARALSPDPALRYPSAAAFAADLRRFLAGDAIDGSHMALGPRIKRHLWRRRAAYLAAAVLTTVATSAWFWAEASADRSRATAELEETVLATDLGQEPVQDLVRKRELARRLIADTALTAAQRDEARNRLAAIEAEGQRRHDDGRDTIVRGAGSPTGTSPDSYRSPSAAVQAAGMRVALEGTLLAPGLAPIPLVEEGWPVLRIAAPVGGGSAAVRVDALEPITGQVVLTVGNGTAPCDFAVPVGRYRVVVGDANAFAECSRTLIAPGTYVVVPRLVATTVAQQDMLPIAAGSAVIGQADAGAVVYAQRTIAHPAFLIDRTEVTCGAYHEYCLATQAPLPRTWKGAYDPAWAQLPVVGVGPDQARAYAEWCGKRLPTWTEWQIAARSPQNFTYPWGNDPAPLARLTNVGRDPQAPWFLGVVAVGTTALDTSWCGALDMLGNVDEWTDTPYVAHMDGVPFPFLPWCVCAGAEWKSLRTSPSTTLEAVGPSPIESEDDGFRCAKNSCP